MSHDLLLLAVLVLSGSRLGSNPDRQGGWKPAECPILTKWAKDVNPESALPEYPRPQMVRKNWLSLNGIWQLSLNSRRAADAPFDQQILVPFPVESALSGVKGKVDDDTIVRYKRTFTIPSSWAGQKVILHFGAVDWEAKVIVNGKDFGVHRGGYDPFFFDITSALVPSGPQTLQVDVTDPTDYGWQARGKQVLAPEGIFYTPTSGIWQTVWLEPVPQSYISRLEVTPDIDRREVKVKARVGGDPGGIVSIAVSDTQKVVAEKTGRAGDEITIKLPNPKLWSPKSAFLYKLRVGLKSDKASDEVASYFAMRKVSLGVDKGVTRIFLNGKPQFMVGPLDQGFWPDGLYTAPTDEALKSDILAAKDLGFNMIRKHVKVEPDRWYYWCDKLGMMVWQDMPSGMPGKEQAAHRSPGEEAQFEHELAAMIDHLYNHPCIVTWVPFNEGWGQYETERLTAWIADRDPSRLVDNASGWTDKKVGDLVDMHNYPGPGMPNLEKHRAAVLGEFGGLGLPVEGHMWQASGWSYQGYKTQDELTEAQVRLFGNLRFLVGAGLSAAVYTQTTDCEGELNGLLTYDRALLKPDQAKLRTAVGALFLPPPTVKSIVPTSKEKGIPWKYTTYEPPAGWVEPAFDDSEWVTGEAGFGTKETPGAVARTFWNQSDIWIRRHVDIPAVKWHAPHLLIHHDDDAEVYVDGKLIAKLPGYVVSYSLVPADALRALTSGVHVIAVHCHQISGGQYIDVGISDVEEPGG